MIHVHVENHINSLILCMKSVFTSPNEQNFSYRGFGNNQRKRCESPFSVLDGTSISDLATPGCVNPPTVKFVEAIEKLASPLTVNKKTAVTMQKFIWSKYIYSWHSGEVMTMMSSCAQSVDKLLPMLWSARGSLPTTHPNPTFAHRERLSG